MAIRDDEGWIAVARAIRKHWLVGFGKPVKPYREGMPTYSRGEAWIDLCMDCHYEPGSMVINGQRIDLQPGQMVGAISHLSGKWNWSPKTVRGYLDKLAEEEMASRESEKGTQKGNQAAVITICNYAEYQIIKYVEGQASGKKRASTWEQKGQQYKDNTSTLNTKQEEEREETGASNDAASVHEVLNGSTTEIAARIASSPDPKKTLKDLTKIVSALTPKTETEARDKQGTRLPETWVLSKRLGDWALEFRHITPDQVRKEATAFKDWWQSQPGAKARKLDWDKTWKGWIRRSYKEKKAEAAPVADDLALKPEIDAARQQQLSWSHVRQRDEDARKAKEDAYRAAEERARLNAPDDTPF